MILIFNLLNFSLRARNGDLTFPDHADHSYTLNDVPYIWVAETGPWPRDVIYFVKCMDHPFPFRKSNDKELVWVPLCHAHPEIYCVVISSSLANGSTFITTTKSWAIPLQLVLSSILPLPCPPPRFYCIDTSHVSIRRPELAYYHCNTLNPSPWPVVLEAKFLSQRHSLARFRQPVYRVVL